MLNKPEHNKTQERTLSIITTIGLGVLITVAAIGVGLPLYAVPAELSYFSKNGIIGVIQTLLII
jgi:hypothetical protein